MNTIVDYLTVSKEKNPNKIAVITKDGKYDYETIYNSVVQFSSSLKRYRQNSVVSIFFDNSVEFVISYLGVIRAGHIAHVISPNISELNLNNQIESAKPQTIITSRDIMSKTKTLDSKNVELNEFKEFMEKSTQNDQENSISSEYAALIYTSGTTAIPKGSLIKHSNILFTTENIVKVLECVSDDVHIVPLSLSHSFGLGCLHTSLYSGSTIILHKNTINPLDLLKSINEYNASTLAAVPPTLAKLLKNFRNDFVENCKRLRLIITNSTAVNEQTVKEILRLFPLTKFATYYGLTEASRSTFMIFNGKSGKENSVGIPAPGVEIKVVGDDGKEAKEGEICIRGKNVIERYWNNIRDKDKFEEGWLKTGDVGRFDEEGYLYLLGRKDNLINVGGEKVMPDEIEKIVKSISGIVDAVAVGVDDELFGKIVKMFVITDDPKLDSLTIMNYCIKNLERYKVPTKIEFVKNLPKTEYGKVQRFLLR